MTLYLDSSALLKLYFTEPESEACQRIVVSDSDWISARHTSIEVRRNLASQLTGRALTEAQRQFARDWNSIMIVELDKGVCETAAEIAEMLQVRTLDSLHLGAAQKVGHGALPLLTYDFRQAQAARALGWTVLGV